MNRAKNGLTFIVRAKAASKRQPAAMDDRRIAVLYENVIGESGGIAIQEIAAR